jgi:puromycin-sensitive aminopeptidase
MAAGYPARRDRSDGGSTLGAMSDAPAAAPTDHPYRLPRNVRPLRYELTIEPDLERATFRGESSTEVLVVDVTDTIVLNAIELEIDEAWIERPDGVRINAEVALDEEAERATLALSQALDEGEWFVHLEFRGILNDKLRGFYRSKFTDEDDVEHTIATTQFEATDARRAFPCWDEPDLKAVFSVTLVVPDHLLAISNGGELRRQPAGDGKVAVTFADTMSMSTYLVAFVVGPLEATAPVLVDGMPLRVVHPLGKGHLAQFALEVGAFALEYFAEYYDIVYPGDTLDLVAIPDFAFGAMENLGCVTFREVLILVDPETATQPELQNVVDVIAHELAHMWFGDLVTMKWWNGIWLNEAFATFMEMLATDAFRPEWDRWVSFGLSRSAAFDVDALDSTRPIEFEVVSPHDAEGMFDILTYEKGAAVVRMLEQYLGADAFREGIRTYLRKHQFDNTETTDLWDALEEATEEPVRRIMDTWIFQGGFPVIDVEIVDDGGTVRLTQHRFRYLDLGSDDTRWSIPLLMSQEKEGAIEFERILLEGDSIDVALWEAVDWVLVNTEGTGFYRVRYAPDLLAALTARAQTQLSPIERYLLVDDLWAFVLSGQRSAVDFLDFAEQFADETDLSVWQRLIGSLSALDRILDGDAREAFQTRVGDLLRPALDRLGDEPMANESDRDGQMRATLFEALGVLAADHRAQARAADLLTRYDADPHSVDPPLVTAAINILAAHDGDERYDDFVARFHDADTPQEELRYLSALADFDSFELMARTLAMTTDGQIRTQNAPYLLRRALTNRDQGGVAWEFIRANWDLVNERFPSNSISRMLEGVRSLSDPLVADTVFAFFDEHELPQGAQIVAQHLERLRVNVALREQESSSLADALLS